MSVTAVQVPPIEDVVPHSGPMLLLDRLTRVEPPKIFASVSLHEGSMFMHDGRVRGMVMVEYMAQAVAAYVGIRDRTEGQPVEIGYLIGIRQMELMVGYLYPGDELEIEAEHVWGDSNLGSFKGVVRRDGEVVAHATLTVYRGEIPEEALG